MLSTPTSEYFWLYLPLSDPISLQDWIADLKRDHLFYLKALASGDTHQSAGYLRVSTSNTRFRAPPHEEIRLAKMQTSWSSARKTVSSHLTSLTGSWKLGLEVKIIRKPGL